MKYAIFGDVGGYADRFIRGLNNIGVDTENYVIPDDLTIVQVGDLVHKGPDTPKVIEMVNGFIRKYPTRWVQLAGNHELPYLTNQRKFMNEEITAEDKAILREWYNESLIHPSYAFEDKDGEKYLVTHAGLTFTNWINNHGGNPDVYAVNEKIRATDWNEMLTWGLMLGSRYPNTLANIFWAEAPNELYASWEHSKNKVEAPFNQIHGHTSLIKWHKDGNIWRNNYPQWIMYNLDIDFENHRTTWSDVSPNGNLKRFYAIDEDFDKDTPSIASHPLIIEG